MSFTFREKLFISGLIKENETVLRIELRLWESKSHVMTIRPYRLILLTRVQCKITTDYFNHFFQ